MNWLARKLDEFVGAVFAGLVGVSCSQLQAFIHQYLQRLGGHLDEAVRNLQRISTAPEFAGIDKASRELLAAAAADRVREIETALKTIREAGVFTRPFVFARDADPDIALAAMRDFQPAIPIDPASLGYAALGVLIALLVYDLVKSPFRLAFGYRGG